MTEQKELVLQDDLPVLGSDDLVKMAEYAEKRVEAINRIKRAALAVTNENDWVDQGGKPYLQVSGAEKIARLFGMSWRIDEPEFQKEETGHYNYTYKGYFTLRGITIEAIGSRGSADPFFSKSHGKDIPPSEIDRNNVRKAAYTNLLGNGITRLLGLRNMTWADVRSGGIVQSKTSKVDYKKKETSQTESAPTGVVNWSVFWGKVKALGLTQKEVHDIAGVESIADWKPEQVNKLMTQLEDFVKKEGVANGTTLEQTKLA